MALNDCWSDKMRALASYARQADDDTLHKTAIRIQSRAIRRCGELLKQSDNQGVRTELIEGALTKSKTAREAGLSERQKISSNIRIIAAHDRVSAVSS